MPFPRKILPIAALAVVLAAAAPQVGAQSAGSLPAKIERAPVVAAPGSPLFGPSEAAPRPVIPPANAKAAPSVPSVPPFPYRYLGTFSEQGGRVIVFLARDKDTYEAVPGGMLGSAYRVNQIGADRLELTYLPMNAPLTLRFSEISAPPVDPIVRVQTPVAAPALPVASESPPRVDPFSSEPIPETAAQDDTAAPPPVADKFRH